MLHTEVGYTVCAMLSHACLWEERHLCVPSSPAPLLQSGYPMLKWPPLPKATIHLDFLHTWPICTSKYKCTWILNVIKYSTQLSLGHVTSGPTHRPKWSNAHALPWGNQGKYQSAIWNRFLCSKSINRTAQNMTSRVAKTRTHAFRVRSACGPSGLI